MSKFLKLQTEFNIRKRELKKFFNQYIEDHNWEPRPKYILVEKENI